MKYKSGVICGVFSPSLKCRALLIADGRGRQNLTRCARHLFLSEADITLSRSSVEKLGVSLCLRRGNFLPLTARSRRDLQLSQAHTAPSVWITGIRDSKNIIRKAFRKVDLCGSLQFVRDNCIQVRAASGYIPVLLYLAQEHSLRIFLLYGVLPRELSLNLTLV